MKTVNEHKPYLCGNATEIDIIIIKSFKRKALKGVNNQYVILRNLKRTCKDLETYCTISKRKIYTVVTSKPVDTQTTLPSESIQRKYCWPMSLMRSLLIKCTKSKR